MTESPSDGAPVFSTRFQGSKRRVLPWLLQHLLERANDGCTILDGFAGSGVVTYGLARAGLSVTSCDRLLSSFCTVDGLVARGTRVSDSAVAAVVNDADDAVIGGDGALRAFQGTFYPDNELTWLGGAAAAIRAQPTEYRNVLFWALFQAALAKRPYNLFHRSNLDMRLRDVERSFGNKATWEKPFSNHFRKFVVEANKFILSDASATAISCDVSSLDGGYDLVYFDPPYINGRGVPTPYTDYYGFLDVLVNPELVDCVDFSKPHKPLRRQSTAWDSQKTVISGFSKLFERHSAACIAVSYRTGGVPTIDAIARELRRHKGSVTIEATPIKYALSKSTSNQEVLILGE